MTPDAALNRLRELASEDDRARLARYGIADDHAIGVPMRALRALRKDIGIDHALALALWDTGIYEARMLAGMVADAARLDLATADRWVHDFDTWAICDTVCFDVLDRVPFRWDLVPRYAAMDGTFVRRTAFALVWAMSTHDKAAPDAAFEAVLPLIETHAGDDRPMVRKGVSMALRALGKRSLALNAAARATAERLTRQPGPAAAVGRGAIKDLSGEKLLARLARV